MKTFETEKHNIPEGATHYRDETNFDSFAWYCDGPTPKLIVDGEVRFGYQLAVSGESLNSLKPIPQANIETPEEKEAFDSIKSVHLRDYQKFGKPRTKVEYAPCEYIDAWEPVKAYCDGNEFFDMYGNKVACPEVVLSLWVHGGLYHRIETKENPQQREERERANAIYDMCASADNFTEESNFWAGKFYDAGYRKESE